MSNLQGPTVRLSHSNRGCKPPQLCDGYDPSGTQSWELIVANCPSLGYIYITAKQVFAFPNGITSTLLDFRSTPADPNPTNTSGSPVFTCINRLRSPSSTVYRCSIEALASQTLVTFASLSTIHIMEVRSWRSSYSPLAFLFCLPLSPDGRVVINLTLKSWNHRVWTPRRCIN